MHSMCISFLNLSRRKNPKYEFDTDCHIAIENKGNFDYWKQLGFFLYLWLDQFSYFAPIIYSCDEPVQLWIWIKQFLIPKTIHCTQIKNSHAYSSACLLLGYFTVETNCGACIMIWGYIVCPAKRQHQNQIKWINRINGLFSRIASVNDKWIS